MIGRYPVDCRFDDVTDFYYTHLVFQFFFVFEEDDEMDFAVFQGDPGDIVRVGDLYGTYVLPPHWEGVN